MTKSELELENSRLISQIELLTLEVNNLSNKIDENKTIVEDAKAIVSAVEPSVHMRNHFKEFSDSLTFVNAEEFFSDKTFSKYIANTEEFLFENNLITFKGKTLATINDDRYGFFLEKVTKVLPWLLRSYVQYARYHNLVYKIKEFAFFKRR